MIALLLAAAAGSASPAADAVAGARHAIEAGRLDQARTMIAAELARGATGEAVDRLLADLAFAAGRDAEALARYEALLVARPLDPQLLERAGLCAARSADAGRARQLLERAVAWPGASWRAWNGLGAVADRLNDFEAADLAYERALALEAGRPEVHNNLGWSRLLRGDWAAAVTPLERAAVLDPRSARIANNLELARAALAGDLPERRPGEADGSFAARLNDAGVAAKLRGETARAVAAFARAIEIRGTWYARAAHNLELAETMR